MATLSSGFNWDPDTFNGASFLGGIVAVLVFAFLMWAVWRVSIGPMIEQYRLRREAMHELRMDQLRSEIRLAVIKELGEEDKSGDDNDGPHDDVP